MSVGRVSQLKDVKKLFNLGSAVILNRNRQKDDLCNQLNNLSLSQQLQLNNNNNNLLPLIKEYRLPSLSKLHKVTVPSLDYGFLIPKEAPTLPIIHERIDPLIIDIVKEDPVQQENEKQAVGLIVIRRRKMNKHKLGKTRKKLKYIRMKRDQRREYKKEQGFQAEEMAKVHEHDTFDAEVYVKDFLKKLNEEKVIPRIEIPKFWKNTN